jgi:CRISPR-associated RAMP protein (TIGR02581 family)
MFKPLYNEATLTVCIEPDGPILIKASESGADPTRPDMEFVRTVYRGGETVYLPGSSLKGVLRAHCERLARTLQPDELSQKLYPYRLSCDPLDDRFSCHRQWEKEKEKARKKKREAVKTDEIYRFSCFVCRLFGNTALASRLRVTDAYPSDVASVRTEERNGVAIDRVFGSVAVGPFNYEVVTAGPFTFSIQLRNFTIAQLGLLALVLRDLEMQRIGIGFAKSRGLGRVKASRTEVAFRYPACTLDETLTLIGQEKPGTLPTMLAGAGMFELGTVYGLEHTDISPLPECVKLDIDSWGEPCLALTDIEQIKTLWRECVKAWRRVVEQVPSKR